MSKHKNETNALWENIKQIGLAFLMAIVIKTSAVEAYKIPSASMEDTLLVGDFLLANKFVYGARLPLVNWRLPAISDPVPGDVVIFIWPGDMMTKYIKRCVAGPGDKVEVRNKILYVNDEIFPNPEFSKWTDTSDTGRQRVQSRQPGGLNSRDNFGPEIIPANHYFMMGDNRDNSSDSRAWGTVHRDLVLGEAMIIHWSWNDNKHPSPEVAVGDPMSIPRLFIHSTIHFFDKVRWSRLFGLIS